MFYVGFCSNKDGISDGQMMERECMDIKEIQQKVGWKCLEMPLSHCWRSAALSEIHICLPETLEANLCEASQG